MNRREEILRILKEHKRPVKGAELGERVGVSRQTLVQDIAFLRKDGYRIVSTTQGYLLDDALPEAFQEMIGITHTPEQLRRELEILVAHHVSILDVMIEHPVYGKVRGELNIRTPKDIRLFLEKREKSNLPLFSEVTGGFHYHTLEADEPEYIEDALDSLVKAGYRIVRT